MTLAQNALTAAERARDEAERKAKEEADAAMQARLDALTESAGASKAQLIELARDVLSVDLTLRGVDIRGVLDRVGGNVVYAYTEIDEFLVAAGPDERGYHHGLRATPIDGAWMHDGPGLRKLRRRVTDWWRISCLEDLGANYAAHLAERERDPS